ncbi:MAG TPA: hypothetical protein VFX21_02545, partial [Acidimicrobiia bacterium]|nr:hypothetical protein [Acidimicrobiia bacterium]
RAVATGRPEIVTAAEREHRRALGFPPFGALAELSGDDAAVQAAADALRDAGAVVLGPSDAKALVKMPTADDLAGLLDEPLDGARAVGRLRVAVDPPRV